MSKHQPTPSLTLFFPCEDASVNVTHTTGDLQYGWWEIRKPLYHVFRPSEITKDAAAPDLCLYYQLSGGQGGYNLFVEYRRLDLLVPKKTQLLMRSDPLAVYCENELAVLEGVVVLKDVPYPPPGLYQFVVTEGGRVLPGGESYLRVFAGEPQ